MPYLTIVFHNVQRGGERVKREDSRRKYTLDFVRQMNVFQTHKGPGATPAAKLSVSGEAPGVWGECVTRWPLLPDSPEPAASGIFLCESKPYNHTDYQYWRGAPAEPLGMDTAIPIFPQDYTYSGFVPFANSDILCAFFEGACEDTTIGEIDMFHPPLLNPQELGSKLQALRCLGTGVSGLLGPQQAPYGSDRYGILFQAARRKYPKGGGIIGVFVHTKNTEANPGTQIAALCRRFPGAIVFGDLNFDLRNPMNYESLSYAVGATHEILAIRNTTATIGNQYYATHYGGGGTTLDYALVPSAQLENVELWAYRPNPAIANLGTNGSDHSVMMLRIQCT